MQQAICDAIEAHHLLKLDYGGTARIVEPHIYGHDSHGHELLSAYQVSGGSLSGEHSGWKLFDLTKVGDLRVLSARFRKPRAAYNPGDRTFRAVYSRL